MIAMLLAHNIESGLRTQDVKISQDITFNTMLLSPNTLNGLKKSGFYRPSPIQLHGIPLGKCGFDLLLEAKSGTGKTAVFSVIALEKLDLSKGLQTVVLAPTREIAAQISDVVKQIGSDFEGLRVEVVMGGLPVQEDILKFKKKNVHIVVGSPGRLRHLIQDKHIDITAVRLLVLDEADKLMEKSFQADVNYIFSVLPKHKQVIMSSATFSDSSKSFIDRYVQCAQHVCPDSNCVLLGVEQKVTIVKYNSNIVKQTQYRFQELLKILSKKQFKQCLIFCNYQARVVELHKMLTREKWPATELYGQQEQTCRLDALKTLQEYKCRILISTDLAARGIDASNVDLVINFEPPFEWQTYLHRIGRAGRYGSYGVAVTILSEGKEEKKFSEILTLLKVSSHANNFWNDDKSYHDDLNISLTLSPSNTTPPIEYLQTKYNYELCWNLLTCSTDKTRKEIESFETLNESFKECSRDNEIEPFSDLIKSFMSQKEQPNEEVYNNIYEINESYKHTKRQIIDMNKFFSFLGNNMNGSKEGLSAEKEVILSEMELKNCKAKRDSKDIDKITIANDLSAKTLDSLHNSHYSNATEVANKSVNMNHLRNHKKNNHDFEIEDLTDALRNAGLPTAFGSSKHNGCKSKAYCNRDSDTNNLVYNNVKSYTNNEKENTKNGKHGKGIKEPICETELPTFYNNEPYIAVPEPKKHHRTHLASKSYDYVYKTRTQHHSKVHSDEFYTHARNIEKDQSNYTCENEDYNSEIQTSSTQSSQSYVNWYDQLKFRMRQIEYAVYINEMSQL